MAFYIYLPGEDYAYMEVRVHLFSLCGFSGSNLDHQAWLKQASYPLSHFSQTHLLYVIYMQSNLDGVMLVFLWQQLLELLSHDLLYNRDMV